MTLRLTGRLLRGGGREGAVRTAAVTVALALATVAVLLAAFVPRIAAHREAVGRDRIPHDIGPGGSAPTFRYQRTDRSIDGRPFASVLLAGPSGTTAPPGTDAFPSAGEVYASPQLVAAIAGNPKLAALVPGRIVGEIGPEGLTRVDELFAYVGRPADELADAAAADGFGGEAGSQEGSGPSTSMVVAELLLFVAAPATFFVAVCARLSSRTRARRWDALRSVGVASWVIARVGGLEAVAQSLPGLGLGLLAFRAVTQLWPEGAVGLRWFPGDVRLGPAPVGAVLVVGATLVYVVGARATSPVEADSLHRADRTGRPVVRSTARLAPLVLGGTVLASTIGVGQAGHHGSPVVLVVGAMAAVVGLGLSLRLLTTSASAFVAGRARSLSLRLGARRAQFEPGSVVRILAGLCAIVLVGFVASGVVADLRLAVGSNLDEAVAVVDVSSSSAADVARIAEAPAEAALTRSTSIETNDPRYADAVVASCEDLGRWVGHGLVGCEPDHVYRVATSQFASDLVPGTTFSFATEGGDPLEFEVPVAELVLDASTQGRDLATNDLVLTGRVRAPLRPTAVAFVVDGDRYDRFEQAVAAVDPGSGIDTDRDPVAIEGYRDHLAVTTIGTVVGGLLAVLCFLVASVDRLVERRGNVASLVAIGVRRRDLRRSQVAQLLLPLVVALVLANLVGWAVAQAYLAVGGLSTGWYLASLRTGALLSAVAVALAVGAGSLVSVPRNLIEHLRAE